MRTKYFTKQSSFIRVWRIRNNFVAYFSRGRGYVWCRSACDNLEDCIAGSLTPVTRDQARKMEPKAFRKA